ncbi:MAG TPA: ATP-binding protein [Terriglobales bacterium]|nr:ATP-binding protein [Terriglobales bacterium]
MLGRLGRAPLFSPKWRNIFNLQAEGRGFRREMPNESSVLKLGPYSQCLRYGVALACVALALAITLFFKPVIEPSLFSIFFAAVIVSVWYGGLGPGLVATLSAMIIIESLFIHERAPSRYLHGYVRLAAFALVSLLINSLTSARKRAEEALRQAHADLELRVRERTAELAGVNESLRFEIGERTRAEEENRRILSDLAERVKELTVLHQAAHLLRDENQPYARVLEEIAKMVRDALRYRDLAASRAAFNGSEYVTFGFAPDLSRKYRADFATPEGNEGSVEIAYVGEPPSASERVFSIEEIRLVDSLSEMLQSYFQSREAAAQVARVSRELATSNRELWRLQSEIKRVEPLAALGQVTGTIAHELGTPLNSVLGYTQLLSQDNLTENARRRLDIIKTQAMRMADIIDYYLTQIRRPLQKHQPIRINALIEETLIALKPIFEQRGVTITTRLADSLPELSGDPPSLQRVLINVLDNSVDAIGNNGCISIEPQPRDASGLKPAGVVIVICDTGTGIPPAILPRVFDMFVTTKAPGEGSGLGLAISQEIVKAHGGTLELSNAPGKGACARIFLPAMQEVQSQERNRQTG